MTKQTHFIFVTGGVVSSLGKGIVGASLGVLLKSQGLKVTLQKFDPYLNVDPGTMSPYQHGEVFVTEDGSETDLDLGHYERFVDQNMSKSNTVTSGMIFWEVLNKERRGDYLGHTVQIIPHVTNEIKKRITKVLENEHFDVIITEVGGTVGDIESLPFLEAIRQFEFENRERCAHIHVTLVPYMNTSGEFKTKPTQHSVKDLREIGISTDIIVCRSEKPFSNETKEKIALFCDVKPECVIASTDADSIYEVPLLLEKEKLDQVILKKWGLEKKAPLIQSWQDYIKTLHNQNMPTITIGIVGKYTNLSDSYFSVVEAIKHAAIDNKCHTKIKWISSEDLETSNPTDHLSDVDGILIPGGFGDRGIEGKISAAKYARENNVPYLGLCLGMHIGVIEFARNVIGLKDAHSTEFNLNTPYPVISLLQEQRETTQKGGTMRLGTYPCAVKPNSQLAKAYNKTEINERHRHRYEFNNAFKSDFESNGLVFSGTSPDGSLVEVIENPKLDWFIACQFHPEFKSRPSNSHPLFFGFIKTALNQFVSKNKKQTISAH